MWCSELETVVELMSEPDQIIFNVVIVVSSQGLLPYLVLQFFLVCNCTGMEVAQYQPQQEGAITGEVIPSIVL